MKEIKFRHKRNGEWVYCRPFDGIKPTAMGQFSGLLDCEGKEIYEGDIVQTTIIDGYGDDRDIVGRVVFEDGAFDIVAQEYYPGFIGLKYSLYGAYNVYKTIKVIGNIYEGEAITEQEGKG